MFESPKTEQTENLDKLKNTIKIFFKDIQEEDLNYGFDFDISRPVSTDLKNIYNNTYKIDSLKITRKKNKIKLISFYIGKTEFHIQGKALKRFLELMETN